MNKDALITKGLPKTQDLFDAKAPQLKNYEVKK
jgi:hypothetical protein